MQIAPIGYMDNARKFSLVTKDGSGRTYSVVASFYRASTSLGVYRLFQGPNILLVKAGGLSQSAYNDSSLGAIGTFTEYGPAGTYGTPPAGGATNAAQTVIFTAEPHGFQDYQKVSLYLERDNLSGLNAEFVIRLLDVRRFMVEFPIPIGTSIANRALGMAGKDSGGVFNIVDHAAIITGPVISQISKLSEPWRDENFVE